MNQKAKTKRSFSFVNVFLWVTLLLVVAILGYTIVDSIGLVSRLDNAAKSDHIKLNESQLDVYRYHVAQNQLYYQYMYIQYGMVQDPTGGLVSGKKISAAEFIDLMIPSYVGSESFDESAYAYAEQYLAYCNDLMEKGEYEQYKKDVADDIESYIEGLEVSAKANGVSLNKYLNKWIGAGVSKADVKVAMEYYYVAGNYAEKLFDDFSEKVTVEEMNKYRDENKGSFYKTSYTSYKLVNKDMKKFGLDDKCASVDAVKTAIIDYYMDQKFEDQYSINFTKANVEDTAGKDKTKEDVKTTLLSMAGIEAYKDKAVFTDKKENDAYNKAAYAVVKAINALVKAQTDKITESSANWSDPKAATASDLNKWLFADGRKEGDTKVIETKSTTKDKNGKETTTYTYTWYIVEKDVMTLDTEYTKNAYYIQLTDDAKDVKDGKTAAQKAEEFYKALEADKTPEKFKELVEKYAPGYSAELNERLSFETVKSSNEDLAKWLFEEGRNKGDITNIIVKDKTDSKKVTGHIIAMFEETNKKTTWELNATDAVANEKLTAWFEEAVEKYHVVVDYEPETTVATTTKAPETTAKKPASSEPTTEKGTEAATTEAGTEAATEPATTSAE